MNSSQKPPTPILLAILDGWGNAPDAPDNAITRANTPHYDRLCQRGAVGSIITHGEAVGLPKGQMGNSEVGHMNLGAGRIVHQELTRIDQAIEDGSFADNPVLRQAMDQVACESPSSATLHLMGLLSPGGVHSHQRHLFALLDMAQEMGVNQIAVHAFLDGRDTSPRSAADSLKKLQGKLDQLPNARLASVSGRYYAMDRDQRWQRTEKAWQAIVEAQGQHAESGLAALQDSYDDDTGDEFVRPTVIGSGAPVRDGDVVVFFNFRADRARQLTRAFTEQDFDGFPISQPKPAATLAQFVTMTRYDDSFDVAVAFSPLQLDDILGQVISEQGLRQARLAETEKYAHVTFFFNGGREASFPGEQRRLIPSPDVATYDLQPQMSAPELTDAIIQAIEQGATDVIICNYANADMVGHTGDFEAAVQAVEAVDACLGRLMVALDEAGGALLLTADHGNAERMRDAASGQPHTAHTLGDVPLIYYGPKQRNASIIKGALQDVAPTLLGLLQVEVPKAMTGRNLLTFD